MLATVTMAPQARGAEPTDLAELIRLRHVLLDKPDAYYAANDPSEHRQWEDRFAAWLATIRGSDDVRVAVIDAPGGSSLAACGIAVIDARPPGPGLLNGRCGWIQSVVTDPSCRSRGYGTCIVEFLMQWFAVADVERVMLHTTSEGQNLYLRRGFRHCGEDAFVAFLRSTSAMATLGVG